MVKKSTAVISVTSLQREHQRLLEGLGDPAQEARGVGAVDHAVIDDSESGSITAAETRGRCRPALRAGRSRNRDLGQLRSA